jgi:hypothetical protein
MTESDMPPPDVSSQESSQTPPVALADLSREIETLKAKWQQENEGFGAWIKKWGAIVGLMAGLIALPKGAYDLYGVMVNRPSTSAMRGLPITMSYDTTREKIRFSFNISVHNAGTADDTISQVWAKFRSPESSEMPPVAFDSSKFEIKEKGDKISLPFTIAKSTSRDLACTIESRLERKTIPNAQGNWVLEIKLEGENKNLPVVITYGLFLLNSEIAEMKRSGIDLHFKNAE